MFWKAYEPQVIPHTLSPYEPKVVNTLQSRHHPTPPCLSSGESPGPTAGDTSTPYTLSPGPTAGTSQMAASPSDLAKTWRPPHSRLVVLGAEWDSAGI